MGNNSYLGYRILSGLFMVVCLVLGIQLLHGFLANTLMPSSGGAPSGIVPTDYWGQYLGGFAGCLMITWAAMLVSAVRWPAASRGIGTATAVGLLLNAVFRMIAWFSGEYAEAGNVPRVEASIMLILALAFIWLRPPSEAAENPRRLREGVRSGA